MPATTTADVIAAAGCEGIGTPTFSVSWERKYYKILKIYVAAWLGYGKPAMNE